MEYKQLGKSSLQVSRIGFGCMSVKPEQTDIQHLIDSAIDSGINYFDTADLYDKGINEINIGKALKAKRDKVIIATKGGNEWKADGSGWNWNPTKSYLLKAVEKSLQRLQTDYIDLYQLHGGTIEDNIDETIEAFELLQQQGKIRYYGISSIRPNVIREYVKRSNIISVMTQYSLLDRRPEESTLSLLQEHNIGVLARGAVAGGLLAGKTPSAYLNYTPIQVTAAANAVKKYAAIENNEATIAIQFALHQPAITSAIMGICTSKHLSDAIKAITVPSITMEEIKHLCSVIAVNYYEQHR